MIAAKKPSQTDRWRGALWGMFVGDALAMPVHWYYDVAALQRDFGVVRDFQAPKEFHPNSIMALADTGGPGRGSQQGEVVGSVILHGKKHLWGRRNRHYHLGLQAGDNTLNLLCVRVLLRSIHRVGRYDASEYLRDYIAWMTTPDSHGDTYAESYHRAFFANYSRGVPPEQCAGEENHDTASIGGLVGLPPVIMATMSSADPSAIDRTVLQHLRLTHRSAVLERYSIALGQLLTGLLQASPPEIEPLVQQVADSLDFPLTQVIEKVNRERLDDQHVIGGMLSPACYIQHSFPAVLYLAARYTDDFEAALIANTNVGGDNCHRGAILGTLLGAALGCQAIPDRWLQGLRSRVELEDEIESFLDGCLA